MREHWLPTYFLLLSGFPLAAQHRANLLKNPGMEEVAGSPALPVHWCGRLFIGPGHHRSSEVARTGRRSAEIRFDGVKQIGYYYSDVCALPLCARVEAGAFVKVSGAGEGAYLIIFFSDSNGKSAGRIQSAKTADSQGEWVRIEVGGPTPPRATQVRLAVQYDGPGAALFDDATLSTVPLARLEGVTLATQSRQWLKLGGGRQGVLGDAIRLDRECRMAIDLEAKTALPSPATPAVVWFSNGEQVGVLECDNVYPLGAAAKVRISARPRANVGVVRPAVLFRDASARESVTVRYIGTALPVAAPEVTAVEALRPASHPRLLFASDNLSSLRDRILAAAPGSALGRFWRKILARADKSLVQKEIHGYRASYRTTLPPAPPPRHTDNYPHWTSLSREIERGMETMAAAYLITQDAKYATRAIEWARALAAWPTWGDPDTGRANGACLSTSHFCHAMAIVYDFCYDRLARDDREIIRDAMLTKGAAAVLREATSGWARSMSWPNGFALVMGGMGIAGSAALGDDARAVEYVKVARQRLLEFLDARGRDGGYVEGMTYGGYAVSHVVPFAHSLELMGDATLAEHPYLAKTLRFVSSFLAPASATVVDFCDSSRGSDGYWCLAALRAAKGDPLAHWYLASSAFGRSIGHWCPAYPLLAYPPGPASEKPDLPLSALHGDIGWVVHRTGFAAGDFFIAIRSGPHGSHCQADQNSWTTNVAGQWLGRDAGYGRGATAEHNTLLVNGKGQSLTGARVSGFASMHDFSYSRHDAATAYTSLRKFRRHVTLLAQELVLIVDEIEPTSDCAMIESRIHHDSGEGAVLRVASGSLALLRNGQKLDVLLPKSLRHEIVTGETPRSQFAGIRVSASGHTVIPYLLLPKGGAGHRLEARRIDSALVFELARGDKRDLLAIAQGAQPIAAAGLRTDAQVAWVRTEQSALTHAAMVCGTTLAWGDHRVLSLDRVGDCCLARQR